MTENPFSSGIFYDYPLIIKKLLTTPVRSASRQEIIFKDEVCLSYGTFFERVNRLASALEQLGVKPGDIVGVLDYNSHRFLECLFAVPMMGATLCTFNWRLALDQFDYTITHARPKVLLVNAEFFPLLEKIPESLGPVEVLVGLPGDEGLTQTSLNIAHEYENLLEKAFRSYDFPDLDENTTATLFYTAGTTGQPKGVTFTHRQIVLHTLSLAVTFGSLSSVARFSSDDVYMPLTPMWNEHAWGMPYLATMLGVKQVYPGKYNTEFMLELFERHQVSFSHCLPTVLHMILYHPQAKDMDLSRCKLFIVGASLHRNLAKAAMVRGIELISAYGIAETCPLVSAANLKPGTHDLTGEQKLDVITSAGLPAPLVELEVLDPQGLPLPHDGHTLGEVVMRAPWLTHGYFKDPERTLNLWRGGWLYSGDIGYIDQEGYLHLTDRVRNVIKTGGEWVSSLRLENIIRRHDAISDAAVVGVPDEKWGERPVVLVVLKPAFKKEVNEEVLKTFMERFADQGEIPKYVLPDRYIIVDEIPKTGVKKINIRMIREIYG